MGGRRDWGGGAIGGGNLGDGRGVGKRGEEEMGDGRGVEDGGAKERLREWGEIGEKGEGWEEDIGET